MLLVSPPKKRGADRDVESASPHNSCGLLDLYKRVNLV